jgi:hypothetical protein
MVRLISFFWIDWLVLALGSETLIILGLSKVEMMMKKSIRKNMMSFMAEVKTSAV